MGRSLRGEAGLSVMEVVVSAAILATSLLAVAGLLTTSLATLRDARDRQLATVAASRALESARALTFDDLVMASVDAPPTGTFDPDGDAAGLTAEVVCHNLLTDCLRSSGAVVGDPYWSAVDALTLRTYVTWVPAASTGGVPGLAKRITAVATWHARAQDRELRQSTIVARPPA